MTDTQFQENINNCVKLLKAYQILLKDCEKEYERRFGFNPSDVDDDWWIDTVHQGIGDTDLSKITETAKLCKKRNWG